MSIEERQQGITHNMDLAFPEKPDASNMPSEPSEAQPGKDGFLKTCEVFNLKYVIPNMKQ